MWCRPAAAAPIQPVTQDLPYVPGAAVNKQNLGLKVKVWTEAHVANANKEADDPILIGMDDTEVLLST